MWGGGVMAAITNSEGSRITGFERRLQDGGVGSVISQALKSKDYIKPLINLNIA